MKLTPATALTIAGSEATGGAGVAADLKTFQSLNVFGMAAITCIVTMDPEKNWEHIMTPISEKIVSDQIRAATSCYSLKAVKLGMLGTIEIIESVVSIMKQQNWKNVVLDPVLICKGQQNSEALKTDTKLKDLLLPLATVVTPNIFEAERLSGVQKIEDVADMKLAANKIYDISGATVVVKGGVGIKGSRAIDVIYDGVKFDILDHEKIGNSRVNGAGCTLAAAITAQLGKGFTVSESIATAKDFTYKSIKSKINSNMIFDSVWQGV